MPGWETLGLFVLACVALAATPGPNLIYLVSRTLAQGRRAGFVSLGGTLSGLAFHVVAAALGLSALLATVPLAYEAVRWAGAAYLAWLAWQTWRSDAGVPAAEASVAGGVRLWREGALTGILNPKVALFQLALFPQFLDPAGGDLLAQSMVLGAIQLLVLGSVDSLFVLAAAGVRSRLAAGTRWVAWSRRLLACVFAGLALRLAGEELR